MSYVWIVWLVIAAIFIAIEVFTPGFFLLWFGVGALVLQAEGEKQAAIARAEGEKQASITRAEGEKQAAILQAEGQAQARLTAAAAEAESIRHIAVGITGGQGNPAQYLIMMKYIESLREMARSNNSKVIFMPVETSSVLSSIGAFKEVFGEQEPVSAQPRLKQ